MKITRKNSVEQYPIVRPRRQHRLPMLFRKGYITAYNINRAISSLLKPSDIEKLERIEGWIHPKEGATLFYFSYQASCGGRVVEIGSYKGKSTAWLATALKLGKICDKVVTIDPHINVKDPEVVPPYDEPTSYEVMLQNLRDLGLLPFVEPIVATSQCAAKSWNQSIRLLFIDGSHRYEDVLLDLRLWEPWLNVGGVICMHDTNPTGPFPGVRCATNEYIRFNKRFREELQLSNLTVFKKLAAE